MRVDHIMEKMVERKIVYLIELVLVILGLLCFAVVIKNNKEDALKRGNQILSRRESEKKYLHRDSHQTAARLKSLEESKKMSITMPSFVSTSPNE